jgi:hypothetical protein
MYDTIGWPERERIGVHSASTAGLIRQAGSRASDQLPASHATRRPLPSGAGAPLSGGVPGRGKPHLRLARDQGYRAIA